MSTSKSEDSNVMSIVSKLIRVLQDSVKVEVIMTLVNEDMASFRLLSRRLRVNHKKLKSNLKPLLSCGIIEEVQIKVADGRVYRAYRLRDDAKRVLQKLLGEPTS